MFVAMETTLYPHNIEVYYKLPVLASREKIIIYSCNNGLTFSIHRVQNPRGTSIHTFCAKRKEAVTLFAIITGNSVKVGIYILLIETFANWSIFIRIIRKSASF